jgi:hypothetical protein
MESSQIVNFIVFLVAVVLGLLVANFILILFNSPYRIGFLGSILITIVLFGIQIFLVK